MRVTFVVAVARHCHRHHSIISLLPKIWQTYALEGRK
jgi:hypothetical protein